MKLAPIGVDPDHFGSAADHVLIHYPTELLELFTKYFIM